jgi:hypothetical protein
MGNALTLRTMSPGLQEVVVQYVATRHTGGRAGCGKSARPDVRPAKADAFSGSESRQGKSQKPCSLDGREEGNRISEAHRPRHLREGGESPGRSAREHSSGPESEAPRRPRNPPRPVAKSAEPGRSYNRQHREVGRRREGGGGVCRSGEAGQYPWSQGTLLLVTPPTRGEAGAR